MPTREKDKKLEIFKKIGINRDESFCLPPRLCAIYPADCRFCSDMLKADRIVADTHELQIDKSLKEILLFYGRPFLRDGNELVVSVSGMPCFLVLDTEGIEAKRIYPFDITACPKEWDISKFEMEPNIMSIPEYVKRYFGNNENYFWRKSKQHTDEPQSLEEAELRRVLSDVEKPDGVKTIEIYCDELTLSAFIKAIIVPETLLDYKENRERIAEYGVKVLDYPDHYPSMPCHYYELLSDKLFKFYKQRKLF